MPKVPPLLGHTPMSIVEATQVFGSEIRMRLLRHYLEHPGSQIEAAHALGLTSGPVSTNTQALIRLGVLEESLNPENRRARLYRVRVDRYRELVQALHDYMTV